MQPEGSASAQGEQGGQQHDQMEPNPDYVQPHDPDPGHVRALAHYSAMAKGTEALWGALESSYYALIDREDVPGGYNAAFFHPLAVYIESHPHEFFLPKLA